MSLFSLLCSSIWTPLNTSHDTIFPRLITAVKSHKNSNPPCSPETSFYVLETFAHAMALCADLVFSLHLLLGSRLYYLAIPFVSRRLLPTRIYCSYKVLYYSLDLTAFRDQYRQSAYTATLCVPQSPT